MILLDKNHPPNAIDGTLKEINRFSTNNTIVKKIALTPYCHQRY